MSGLLIIGAGGHGRVVADAAEEAGRWDKIAFLDDWAAGTAFKWPVLAKTSEAALFLDEYEDVAVALGDNRLRVEKLNYCEGLGFNLPAVVHPAAAVSKRAEIGAGSVVLAQAAVNAGAVLGRGCIVNTGATVDHDCLLEEGVHLSPGVHLGGEVKVGRFSWLGVGASVINRVTIGRCVTVGAGTVVISDVEDNVTVVGVPGRVIKKNGK
ncbi:MAG: acetyltransferase [Peptococcaceae bacterium]|jgi:sugar O-acyltransferase (sialic acid O-acetyltransferase NeuD family)|nr:acetyltransferase [Peptococcaceae bacterium]MDH7525994.1 acetyltransferase [Peptococcaceae bacterium]